ncbi:hypothetical protein BDM02DRAFT_2323720 [Thelephora ganbajun]|uniref:Uncharacterized protein n=1 Tax=Thelephora ganbajun TaxID=370292 RepID=A0ACB6ZFX0_THEGA|nr:hypothetical protein BDM02DRAFT_2323720 [Thelephora ganbajun]
MLVAEIHTLLPFRRYGSGYPNATAKSVKGRGLPFFFYPIRYGRYPNYGPTYIYDNEYGNDEYGGPGNKHRPGGHLHYITIQPPKSLVEGPYPDIPSMTLYAVADEPTLKAIKSAVQWRCSRSGFTGWFAPDKVRVSKQKKFKGPAEDPNGPVPEQAASYYRGSSVALFLVGYNNTAQVIDYTFQDHPSLEDTPLPSVADTPFFQCINVTLGESIPLVITMGAVPYQHNAASSVAAPQTLPVMLLVLVLVIWRMPIW